MSRLTQQQQQQQQKNPPSNKLDDVILFMENNKKFYSFIRIRLHSEIIPCKISWDYKYSTDVTKLLC